LGQATTLTATITAGSNVAYVWDFGDGMPGSGSPVIHVYPATGLYTAIVTASNPVSVITATTTVVITGGQRLCWARLNDDPTDYTTVQAAIDASTHPTDVVKVAGYCSIINHYGGASQVAYVDKTLTVRGGYTTTNWNVSDPISYPTTLDAQGQGRVLYIVGDGTPVIEGLRLTGGDADGLGCAENPVRDCGGGIYIGGAPATIRNCEVSDSTASWYGGGIYLDESSAVLDRNDVVSNTSGYFGGGVFLQRSGATLSGNTISYNVANSQYGGGLYVSSSGEVVLVGNTVTYNDAEIDGGGLYLTASDGTMLSGNVIGGNTAQYGGGLSFFGSDAILVNNVVVDNQTEFPGGGLHIMRSSPRMWHTTVARNSSPGIYVNNFGSGTSIVMLTNTIVANHVTGLFVASGGTTVTLQNTLWHGNTTPWSGGGVIIRSGDYTGDPAFVDPDGGDYHIRTESAALDAGLFAGVTTDIDGDVRPTIVAQPDAPDLGADENKSTTVRRAVMDTMTFGAACARIVFTDTDSLSYVTVTVVYTYPTGYGSDNPIPRYYTITPDGTDPYTASLALCYTDAEFAQSDINSEDGLQLYRFTGSSWDAYASKVYTPGNVATATLVTAFSDWALGGPGGEPTAVDLASFTAEWNGDRVSIAWETTLEIDTVGFNLWRSTSPDGSYVQINGVLIPAASPGGVWGGSYAYADANVAAGTIYYYKLEEVEVSGARNWHGPVSTTGKNPTSLTLLSLTAEKQTPSFLILCAAFATVSVGLLAFVRSQRRRR
jgi:parallel beta-helix repeat protein